MPIVRNGSIRQADLVTIIDEAIRKVEAADEDVVRIRYSIGPDHTGDDSVFFRIVLTDFASEESRLGDVSARIEAALIDEIRPYENWDILAYFNFRSRSEQAALADPTWA